MHVSAQRANPAAARAQGAIFPSPPPLHPPTLTPCLDRQVLEMGANAVLGFRQHFDLEPEERTITARAIGTAVKLSFPDPTAAAHTLSSDSKPCG